jgi:hypothetical protein
MIKKIIISLVILLWLGFIPTFAEDTTTDSPKIKVEVTEFVPWAWCVEKKWSDNKVIPWKYECEIKSWFTSVVDMIWAIIRYFTYIVWLWAVLWFVINWIRYAMWEKKAKEDIVKTLWWIILLLLSWVILHMIAPWIYTNS